jgi:hypothetical protein
VLRDRNSNRHHIPSTWAKVWTVERSVNTRRSSPQNTSRLRIRVDGSAELLRASPRTVASPSIKLLLGTLSRLVFVFETFGGEEAKRHVSPSRACPWHIAYESDPPVS